MKLEHYSPTSRNVLLREVKVTKTEGGIYLPSTEFITEANSKVYDVIKVGKDCTELKVGDQAKLMRGMVPDKFDLDNVEYTQVMEQQVMGYFRKPSKR